MSTAVTEGTSERADANLPKADYLARLVSKIYAKARADAERAVHKSLMSKILCAVPSGWCIRVLPKMGSSTEYAVRIDLEHGPSVEYKTSICDAKIMLDSHPYARERFLFEEAVRRAVAEVLIRNCEELKGDDQKN